MSGYEQSGYFPELSECHYGALPTGGARELLLSEPTTGRSDVWGKALRWEQPGALREQEG